MSGHETRIEKDEKVGPKENGVFIKKGDEAANQLPDVEENLGVMHSPSFGACTRNVSLSHQVDIVCGDGNQSWYFRSSTHKVERTDSWETVTQNLSMD